MREHNSNRYICMFGGGAIRGAAHVGVVKALDELKIETPILVGSSVGALFAMLYAVGCDYKELSEVFLSVNFELFRDISLGFNQKFAISKGEVFLEWLRELIEKKFYGDSYNKGNNKPVTFKDINKNLIILTTNMNNFESREFSTFETPNFEIAMAVRISCCMPGLMRAVTMEDELLVDGDLKKGKPMWQLSKNLKTTTDRLLEIRLEGDFFGNDNSPIDYVNGMYSCMTSTETNFIKNLYCNSDNYDYLVINTGNVVVVDFNYPNEKRQAIIDKGYNQTIKYFKKDLVDKKVKFLNIYSQILLSLKQIKGFFNRKKYIATKNTINELLVELFDISKDLDIDILSDLKLLQKLASTNIKSGLLGRSTCTNQATIEVLISNIINDLELRINDLNTYIDKYKIN